MALAVILFAGFIGIALVAVLTVLAFIDVAFNVWDSTDRASRDTRHAVPSGSAAIAPPVQPARVHQWAQSA